MKMNFIYKKTWIILVTLFSLTSCSIHKKEIAANEGIPEQYLRSKATTSDSVQLPYTAFIHDALLITYIDEALKYNRKIQVALKTTAQLDLIYKQAKQSLMPTLNLTMQGNRTQVSKNSLNGSLTNQLTGNKYLDDYNASLQLNWEVDIWGKSKLLKREAQHSYFEQQEQVQALKTRIVVQVAQAYYHLVALDEQLAIATRNIALSEETLQMIRLQFSAGKTNSLAVQQAEAQKIVAALLVPQAKQQIAVQENALNILIGREAQEIKRTPDLNNLVSQKALYEDVPAKLLSRRPDLREAEHRVYRLGAKTGLSKIAMYPSISLTPSIGMNSYLFSNWFDLQGSLVKTIAGNLTQPLLNKEQLKTQYQTDLLEQDKAALQFQELVLKAVAEVSDAMANSQGATERKILNKNRALYLNQATTDATLLFKSGRITYLDVIFSQNNQLQNQLDALTITLEILQAELDLYRALGGVTEA